jgi:hypothetical protein
MISKISRALGRVRRSAGSLDRSSAIARRLDEARSTTDYVLTIELFRLRGLG